jgi:multiple sugar transport system permease protein
MSKHQSKHSLKLLISISLSICFFILFFLNLTPLIWGFLTSIKAQNEIFTFPPKIFDFTPTFANYSRIIQEGFIQSFLNSIFFSISSVLLILILGLLAGYGFDRFSFKFKNAMFFLVLLCVPLSKGGAALILPDYIFMSKMGLTNHWYTLIILYTAYHLPISVWIIKAGIESVPREIDEAAKVDGCSLPYFLFRMMPMFCKPALSAAAIFSFLAAWNEFILSSIMINSAELRPVQLTIYKYLGFFGQEWGPLTASSIFAVFPILILFSVLSKTLISGLGQGATKG